MNNFSIIEPPYTQRKSKSDAECVVEAKAKKKRKT